MRVVDSRVEFVPELIHVDAEANSMRIITTANTLIFAEGDAVILRLVFDDGPAEVPAVEIVDDYSPDELILDVCMLVGRMLRAEGRGTPAHQPAQAKRGEAPNDARVQDSR